jgi:serine/threonine-protein kinase
MLLSGEYASAAELAQFMREARAVAALEHPNIVQIHDVSELDGRPYFTMEFVDGGSLAQKLARVPQAAAQAAALVVTLAEAVHAAHRSGIVHRDLKPGNVLLTKDGTPKISDFGLARRFESDESMTLTGVRVGTPSYMSPEQAGGKPSAVGPATDIYSLGAILYEMLTGRPPFHADTATETQRQVIAEEPAAPSRLNSKVPRDLETICLKCLHKDPERRYSTSAALADDLRRFLKGEPILARPVGWLERSGKWVRRRPAWTTAIAGGLLLSLLLVSGGVWFALERRDLRHAIEVDLKDVAALQQQARWPEARNALERAEARMGPGVGNELRRRVHQATTDLDLATTLDKVRLTRATSGGLVYYKRKADEKYAEVFQRAGLGAIEDDPQGVGTRVKRSAVRTVIVAALDDWAVCAADERQRTWILDVAREADPDPDRWRDRILDPASWADPTKLSELARIMPTHGRPLSLQLALGERWRAAGGDPTAFLRRVQNQHPDDFWANLALGNALLFRSSGEARGYYRAALASRPQAAVGYCAVGDALRMQNSLDEAVRYYQSAIERDPSYARIYANLGLAFQAQGKSDQAIGYFQKSLKLDPNYMWAYYNLGNVFRNLGRADDAMAQYQKALAVDPNNLLVEDAIRVIQVRRGHAQEVWAAWHQIIETDPLQHEAWWGYPELTLFLGKTDQYHRARQLLLKRYGDSMDPLVTEKVARACLLLPGSDEEMHRAAVLADRAVDAKGSMDDWIYPYFMFAKGLAEYRQGRPDNTITIMKGEAAKVLGPAPKLLLAMAQHHEGNTAAARTTLTAAIGSFDWSASRADSRDVWMCHILRQEAEATILGDPAATQPSTSARP